MGILNFLKILVVHENFLAFGFKNLVLIVMVQPSPNTNISGVIWVIVIMNIARGNVTWYQKVMALPGNTTWYYHLSFLDPLQGNGRFWV